MTMQAPALDLRYPIGQFEYAQPYSLPERAQKIRDIEDCPAKLRAAVSGLNQTQIDTPYRDGGWTVRQTVHHIADSHINSFIRFRFALTEDNFVVKPYNEKLWAELPDVREPVEVSLQLLEALHHRWIVMLKALTPEQWKRTMNHPEFGPLTLDKALGLYSWHSRHHVAHITGLRKRMNW